MLKIAFQITLSFLLCTCSALANVETHSSDHASHQLIGSHGMVLFQDNNQNTYASHLPLYVSPHHYQIIYRIDNNKALLPLFNKGMVTVLPNKFDLNKLINGEKFSVPATFFEGHFERGGKAAFKGKITFTKQIIAQKVDKEYSENTSRFYITPLNEELSLYVHKIQKRPSFDAIGFTHTTGKTFHSCSASSKLNQTKLTHKNIVNTLKECGLSEPVYLETQDFK